MKTTNCCYDAKSNTTSINGAVTYIYDGYNRLSSASGMSYYVNPEGQRLKKSSTSGSAYFAPDKNGSMLAETQGSGWTDYVWLGGKLIGKITNAQPFAIFVDQVGRPEVVSDATQSTVWRAQNFPSYQNVVTAKIALNLGFPGQYYDAETSTWNNGFRDYSSVYGRYIESDPLGLAAGINTYAYVENNPLSNTDPLGLEGIGSWTFAPDPQQDEYNAFKSGGLTYGNGSGNYMATGASIGMVGGTLVGLGIVAANVAGFPEVEIGEGLASLEFLDVIGGEPVAKYIVGGVMAIGPGTIIGGLIGYIATPKKIPKNKCPK